MSEYFCQPPAGYDGDVNSVRADGPLPYGTERMCEPRFEKVIWQAFGYLPCSRDSALGN